MSNKTTTPNVTTEDIYGLGGNSSVSALNSRKMQLIEEETRLKFVIDSICVIGNVDFKQPDGSTKTSYQIGVGLTSNRSQRYEDNGEDTGRNVSFFLPYTLSFNPKANLVKSGLLQAVDYDLSLVTLPQIIGGLVGKQVSAMIAHRKYKTKDGQDAIAMDVEKFKPVTDQDDFAEALAKWKPNFMAAKRYPSAKIVTVSNVQNSTPAKSVSYYAAGSEKPQVSETVKLS